ncbi:Augmin complex subunit dgt6 [Anthophora plagiata]
MAVSASFHRNVLLLSQVIEPSDEFKKHFREGMFDKPNTAGFLHVSYYLLTIYDSDRFKKLIEWPVNCKKAEVKYRNNIKDYLISLSMENPNIGFPNILMSHLIHAGGRKFTIIMWKLSEVVVRRYITRETSYNVMLAPRIGRRFSKGEGNLTKKFLQEINAKIKLDIVNQHKNLLKMENTTKLILEEKIKALNNIIAEIFEIEQIITCLSHKAPVHPSVEKRLRDINDGEVIKMWKMNVNDGLNCIQKKNAIIKETEQLTLNINDIILSNSSDVKMLDAKQLQKVNHLQISELFSPNMQCLLFQLYKNDKIMLNNFIALFNFLLTQLCQRLKLNTPEDFSECLLQIEASNKDVKAALNIIQSYLSDITDGISKTHDILEQKNVIQVHDDTVLPVMNNTLIMLSPLIKIDTNCNDVENDLQKRLQLTPVEASYKSLFSRYARLKKNHISHRSKLKENLLVSRINFEDTIATTDTEKQPLHLHTISSRRSVSTLKQAEKYSRLFSTRAKRNNKTANSSMSVSCSSKANSTAIINTIEEMHDISELSLNISTNSLPSINVEFITPEKFNVKTNKSESTSQMENMTNDFPHKDNVLDICETIREEITNNYDNNIINAKQSKQRRGSIGDLVERYKKLLQASSRTSSPKINYVKCDNE